MSLQGLIVTDPQHPLLILFREALREIESSLGPAHESQKLIGIEISNPKQVPLTYAIEQGIVIRVTDKSSQNENSRVVNDRGEMLHECVHFLDPGDVTSTTRLEEGLACLLSRPDSPQPNPGEYLTSYNLTRELLDLCPNVVKDLRVAGSTISGITADMLLAACPSLAANIAEEVTKKFSYEGIDTKI